MSERHDGVAAGLDTSAATAAEMEHVDAGDAPLLPPLSPPQRIRKLSHGHFAFARALVQGLDTRAMWNRYLRIEGEHTDIRTVRKTIAWLRDEFAAAAKRHDRHGTARLVQIDVSLLPEKAMAAPSLDDFIAERELDGFSEQEQLALYQDEYGTPSARQSRRTRLIRKQLEALAWLENLIAAPPHVDDGVGAWLHPDLALRLEAAGIMTLRQLLERINGVGRHWWRRIPAIGESKAARIVEWLHLHAPSIGLAIGGHATRPRSTLPAGALADVVPRATAIVPIEKLIVPADLSGAAGLYRLPQHLCLMRAANDHEAILAWVRSKRGLPPEKIAALKRRRGLDPQAPERPLDWLHYLSNTQRAYLKEAERFLLWAVIERNKPLSSMSLEDCIAYRAFLANPQPVARWCGPRTHARWSPLWRPFEGPLKPAALRRAIVTLKILYGFLSDQRYLHGNPWSGVETPKASEAVINVGRSFTQDQWAFVEGQLAQLPPTSANLRLRCALHLFYATGLRLSEAVAAQLKHLAFQSYPVPGGQPVEVWELTVLGKGTKKRFVPVAPDVVDELRAYLAARGVPADLPAPGSDVHLLGKAVDVAARAPWSPAARQPVDREAGIGAATLYDQMKGFFRDCAAAMHIVDPASARRFEAASAHWLRHTHGSHAVAAGVDLKVVQENLGHASVATTTAYTTSEERRRAQETAKLWEAQQRRRPPPPAAGAATPAAPVLRLVLHVVIENNSQFVRGRKKARRWIEDMLLGDCLVEVRRNGDYVLDIPYDDEEDMERAIDDLFSEIHLVAEGHHCFIDEMHLHDEANDRYWP